MSEEKEKPYTQRGPSDCWPFRGDRSKAPNKSKRMACEHPWCCNPAHVVPAEAAKAADERAAARKKAADAAEKTAKAEPVFVALKFGKVEVNDEKGLEAYARKELDVELDRRHRWKRMLKQVQDIENALNLAEAQDAAAQAAADEEAAA